MSENKDWLEYEIVRGEDKIGENLIEIRGHGKRILLECGKALFPDENTAQVEEYVKREKYDAIIISHAHEDHCGLLKDKVAAKTIYMGEVTLAILQAKKGICAENVEKVKIMKSEEEFFVGDIKVVPHLCDHSVADSYMIEICGGEKRILYTGDFRSNGRKHFESLIERLPQKVDTLISEKTIESEKNETEQELEKEAVRILENHKEAFVLQSSLNVDRIVSFYKASRRTKATFLMLPLHAQIAENLGSVPSPNKFKDCFVYYPHANQFSERKKVIGREQIARRERFVMLISTGMKDYLQKLSKMRDLSNAVLIYSMWDGYKEQMREFLDFMKSLGVETVDLHVSGHADKEAIEAVIKRTNPREIKFVHTDGHIDK